MDKGFFEEVYSVVKQIPLGKVATYGMVAKLVGRPKMARYVGYALHANPMPGIIPCHRVVNREGKLTAAFAFGGIEAQRLLLEKDGIIVIDGRVDLNKYLWEI